MGDGIKKDLTKVVNGNGAEKIKNNFEGIVIKKAIIPQGVSVKIRKSYNPLNENPIVDILCKCGENYTAELFYLAGASSGDIKTLTCPNLCGKEVFLYYCKPEKNKKD